MKKRNQPSIDSDPPKIREGSSRVTIEINRRTIKIHLEGYQNIQNIFPVCDIKTQCHFKTLTFGETNPVQVTDSEIIPVGHDFDLKLDTDDLSQLKSLISYPAILKVYLTSGNFDPALYDQLSINPQYSAKPSSLDTVISIYEALIDETISDALKETTFESGTENTPKKTTSALKKEKFKTDRQRKNDKRKQSMSSLRTISSEYDSSYRREATDSKKLFYGYAIIDFLPLMYGATEYKETLLLQTHIELRDDRMVPYKKHPKVIVTVSIDEPLAMNYSMLMNFSIESIFNIHSSFANCDIQLYCALPNSDDSILGSIELENPTYTTEKIKDQFKNFPKEGDTCYPSKYHLSHRTDNIRCKFEVDLNNCYSSNQPRLEYNIVNRSLFTQDGKKCFEEVVKIYKNIILEMYVTLKSGPEKTRKTSLENKMVLHLMAVVDVSGLLYPGSKKTRVAAPLRTFCLKEATTLGGLKECHSKSQKTDNADKPRPTKILDREKKSNLKTTRSKKSSKNESCFDLISNKNVKHFSEDLEELEYSEPILDDNGRPSFIVVEIELSEPLVKEKDAEDLTKHLNEILKKNTECESKIVLNSMLSKTYYEKVLNAIILDMNQKFVRFLEDNPKYEKKKDKIENEFVQFLKEIGSYKLYLNSITQAISMIGVTETRFNSIEENSDKVSMDFIGELYCYLISKMNETVNSLICSCLEPSIKEPEKCDQLYLYGKEAVDLGLVKLAERYFLERLSNNESNADYWFDYTVYCLDQNDFERAFESAKIALSKNSKHKYSLLLFGVMLHMKHQLEEAETCFLNLMSDASKWVEGWGVLYIFYKLIENEISKDWALEMAQKNIYNYSWPDYFVGFQECSWSSEGYPNTVFFRTAILLIKMRLLNWAEIACSEEMLNQPEFVNELLAVICFYKKGYQHAINHLATKVPSENTNMSIVALRAYCYSELGQYNQAIEDYDYVLKSEHSPKDFHIMYLRYAGVLNVLGDSQGSRKLILVVCKYKPSAYSWLKAGQLYYVQHDFLSAEECLSTANSLDVHYAEIWGYLTLVNLKLLKYYEADQCYKQALRNKLDEPELLDEIAREKEKEDFCL